MSIELLQDKIRRLKFPAAAGLEPGPEGIPPELLKTCLAECGPDDAPAEALYRFQCGVLEGLGGIVPAVRLRGGEYERFGWRGVRAMERVMARAKELDFYVIADISRAELGQAAQASAEGWLTRGSTDCVTLCAYAGSDAVRPFLEVAVAHEKAVFLHVKSDNPSSGEMQTLVAGDRLVYNVMGDLAGRLGKGTSGQYGYNAVGAVVGTGAGDLRELRRRLEQTFFLVADYGGCPGARAEDVRHAFDHYGRGAVVGFSPLRLTGSPTQDAPAAAREAALALRGTLRQFITIV